MGGFPSGWTTIDRDFGHFLDTRQDGSNIVPSPDAKASGNFTYGNKHGQRLVLPECLANKSNHLPLCPRT